MIVCVYAMITELTGGSRYVKFGMAKDPEHRLANVKVGCPLKIETLAYVECESWQQARFVESAIHLEHIAINCAGEWFKWSSGSTAERDAKDALRLLTLRETGRLTEVKVVRALKSRQTIVSSLTSYRRISKLSKQVHDTVIGDMDSSDVSISMKRRKSLILNA